MEAVMLDFKQVKKQMTNVSVGHVDKLSLVNLLAFQNIASKFYKILPRITTKALILFFSLNILFYYGIKEQEIMSNAKYETITPPSIYRGKKKNKT